jgi:hypothetical protein
MIHADNTVRSEDIKVLATFAGSHRVCLWRNVSITIWFGKPTLQAVEGLAPLTEVALTASGYSRFSVIHLVADQLALPDSQTRSELVHMMKEHGDRMGCMAVIVSATGFWASAMRSVITGIRVLAPRTFDLRMHANAEELISWFPAEHRKRTGVEIDIAGLRRTLAQAKSWQDEESALMRS